MTIVPLNRLLKERDARSLLAHLQQLHTQTEIAILHPDGQLYVGTSASSSFHLETLPTSETVYTVSNQIAQAIIIDNNLICILVCRGQQAETLIAYLHYALKQLLDTSLAKRQLAQETLERYREINLLYRIGESIGKSLDVSAIPALLLDEAYHVIPFEFGVVIDDATGQVVLRGTDKDTTIQLLALRGIAIDTESFKQAAQAIVAHVTETLQPTIDTLTIADNTLIAICAPITSKDIMHGYLVLVRVDTEQMFTAGDEKLLMAIVQQGASALEISQLHEEQVKHQLLEKELEVGQRIQRSLLPAQNPNINGWEFAAYYQAAKQVGGDFYDFIALPQHPDWLALVIADVTGKGIPAAIYMALCRSIIRTSARSVFSPVEVLQKANEAILEDSHSNLFTTLFYALLNTKTGEVIFANAGHDYPILKTQTDCQFIEANGFVLGAFRNIKLEEKQLCLEIGDMLIFYTDGITEARNSAGKLFGDDHLLELVAQLSDESAANTLVAIMTSVQDFAGTQPQADDFTLLIVKRVTGIEICDDQTCFNCR